MSYYASYFATGDRTLLGGVLRSRSSYFGSRKDCEKYLEQTLTVNREYGIACDGVVQVSKMPPQIFAHCPGSISTVVGAKCFSCGKTLTLEDAHKFVERNDMGSDEQNLVTDAQAAAFDQVAEIIGNLMAEKGFNDEQTAAHSMGLVMTELAEVIESERKGTADALSNKTGKTCTNMEEEVADAVIRLLHFAHRRGLRIGTAITAKMQYNAGRPYKHGCAY